jgi:hypothetical protein
MYIDASDVFMKDMCRCSKEDEVFIRRWKNSADEAEWTNLTFCKKCKRFKGAIEALRNRDEQYYDDDYILYCELEEEYSKNLFGNGKLMLFYLVLDIRLLSVRGIGW